ATGLVPGREPVLDICCGSGEIAAWLAAQGYDVTGVDFAESAIARARASYGEARGLRFEPVDICRQVPDDGPYGVMLDRGCLHGIERHFRSDYLQNVAAAAKPGAHFLLLHVVGDTPKEKVVRELQSLCGQAFDVVRISDATLSG